MLTAEDISVSFGGVPALQGVSVTLERGQIRGVIGPNGSGKSTLFNCLTGFIRPDAGTVSIDDRDISTAAPHERITLGIGRTFQTPRFDPKADVWQALACGFYPATARSITASALRLPSARRAERRVEAGVGELLERFNLTAQAGQPVGELPLGTVRLVEVARAMATSPGFLLLDEPAAGLTEDEQELLAGQITALAQADIGVLLVEHNFDLVVGLSDEITVLANGTCLVEGLPDDVAADSRVRSVYLGLDAEEAVDGERERQVRADDDPARD